ncbi:hypothetical protein ACGF5M_03150 [Gemmatimonadota bacterium]
MRRSWTDRDGVEWEVEKTGGWTKGLLGSGKKSSHWDPVKLIFRSGSVEYPPVKTRTSRVLEDLTQEELQHLLDEARANKV